MRIVLWLGVRDTTAGFVCYRRKVLETIDLDDVRFIGYAFQIEMKYRTKLHGFSIREVPITFVDRVKGRSKMSMNIFQEAFWGVLKMRSSSGHDRAFRPAVQDAGRRARIGRVGLLWRDR